MRYNFLFRLSELEDEQIGRHGKQKHHKGSSWLRCLHWSMGQEACSLFSCVASVWFCVASVWFSVSRALRRFTRCCLSLVSCSSLQWHKCIWLKLQRWKMYHISFISWGSNSDCKWETELLRNQCYSLRDVHKLHINHSFNLKLQRQYYNGGGGCLHVLQVPFTMKKKQEIIHLN
jgi:hypothetical protein